MSRPCLPACRYSCPSRVSSGCGRPCDLLLSTHGGMAPPHLPYVRPEFWPARCLSALPLLTFIKAAAIWRGLSSKERDWLVASKEPRAHGGLNLAKNRVEQWPEAQQGPQPGQAGLQPGKRWQRRVWCVSAQPLGSGFSEDSPRQPQVSTGGVSRREPSAGPQPEHLDGDAGIG